MKSESPWVEVLRADQDAVARLICFHQAGSNAANFRTWKRLLAPQCELLAVELPGHGSRFREPLPDAPEQLVATLAAKFVDWTDLPYALFGHSMGALLAYELACAAQRLGARAPSHLFICGRGAPHVAPATTQFHLLAEEDFLMGARVMGTPERLLEVLAPILRADLKIIETYRYTSRPPLACTIGAFRGSDDWVTPEHARAWSELTTGAFEYLPYEGGHFLGQHERNQVIVDINRILTCVTDLPKVAALRG